MFFTRWFRRNIPTVIVRIKKSKGKNPRFTLHLVDKDGGAAAMIAGSWATEEDARAAVLDQVCRVVHGAEIRVFTETDV